MLGRLSDFNVELLKDGTLNFFFPCGHSVMGKNVVGQDLTHKCPKDSHEAV